MNIDKEAENLIQKLINTLRKEYKVPGYTHNIQEDFVAGKTPVYYSGAYFDDKEVIASVKSMLIGKWMTSGENVKEFEKGFSKKINNKFSFMTNSGSSANLLMIASLKKVYGWKDGDEIIVSAVGFPTTVSVIPQNNLVPVFAEIEMNSLNFDLNHVENKITNKTVAIFLSPVLGNPPNINFLLEICKKHDLKLILDGCDSLGSTWDNKNLSEYAVASSCSFYAAHHICTFEGGMVSSDNREVINVVRSMANWGRDCICSGVENLLSNGICNHRFDNWLENYDGIIDHKYLFSHMGYNLKPLDVSGAIGVVQLDKLDEICLNRNISKESISDLFLKHIKGIRIPMQYKQAKPVWFGTPIICENKNLKNSLVAHLEKNLIQTRHYFAGNILLHPGYKHLGDYREYPLANKVLDTVFFVGASPSYREYTFDYIEDVLKGFEQ